jgi:hypothetical protein
MNWAYLEVGIWVLIPALLALRFLLIPALARRIASWQARRRARVTDDPAARL